MTQRIPCLLILCMLSHVPVVAHAGDALSLVGGRVTLDSPVPGVGTIVTVTLGQTYVDPVVFVLPTDEGADPASVRVFNVTSSSFDVAVVEPPGSDGANPGMTVDYLVVEKGTHTLPDSTRLEAGVVVTTAIQSKFLSSSWVPLSFAHPYGAAPAVLLELQSRANEPGLSPTTPSAPWLNPTARNLSAGGVEVAMDRAEVTAGTVALPETLAYLAVEIGSGSFPDTAGVAVRFESLRSTNSIVGWSNSCVNVPFSVSPPFGMSPLVLASLATRDGADGGWLRRCSVGPSGVGLLVDEDTSNDADRSHTTEMASILAFSNTFLAAPSGIRLEAGSITVPSTSAGTLAFTSVSFPAPGFSSPPLVFPMPTDEGSAPAALRIRNVTASGFEMAQVEPSGETGAHPSMTVDYFAAAPGTHTLPGGTELIAGSVITDRYVAGTGGSTGDETVVFPTPFAAPPTVLLQVQTIASEPLMDPSSPSSPWLVAAMLSLSPTQMTFALERAEAISGSIVPETLGYLILPSGITESLLDDGGVAVDLETLLTGASIAGWDNGCTAVPYAGSYSAPPVSVAHQASRGGSNGGWMRKCTGTGGSDATRIVLTVDEDRASDSERSHVAEAAGILVASQPFAVCLKPAITLSKSATVFEDPVNGLANPKAIPGSSVDYLISAVNSRSGSTDDSSLVILEPIPLETALFVGDFDGGGAPVAFDPGVGPSFSGLDFTFSGLGNIMDGLQFSANSGSTWTYVPVPDAEGFDPQITHLRVLPGGRLRGAAPGQTPAFSIGFRVRTK